MDLTYATILILAAMIFVLAGMLGYLYWQQTRMLQHIGSLSHVVASLVEEPAPQAPTAAAEPAPAAPEPEEEEEEEDDRVSVEASPEEVDVDDLQGKTKDQLQELLNKKGLPFNKRDNKTQLIELLKATA
jgi:hypothetical protein